ncbi:type II toxin-antitoxin system ParD family antitoxin [Amaricoccus solimangrovi]|uniref:Type II toxin-antitoxin system ParD family antitoxin n=1 Tax=Amaricoccus solimangrovi TaxID=2589815 RepID=A0A501WZW2_9RHOB|nr:type II toxin-antitoxin system ParD family antitoxin [Amaricoccus solimangrovi]TPE51736.1 type II toxin-antitoxin system ParD family antitoxin [Amaricoccus solimangrovi]
MTTSRNPSISLSDQHRRLVDDLVAAGRYQGVSEVVREGLRLLEDREARRARALAEIDAVVREGVESGSAGAMDLDAIVAEAERRARRIP